jgi:alkanesulfonate monooxygenase SsuD/methylene tetrahydromethanopterin reductase-like flavin-dependent oxidoreductase (luciferase family)
VKLGIVVPQGWREDLPGRDFETTVAVARRAEELGFESIWLYDHLQTRDGDPDALFECWTTLAAIARETSRVRLGQIVTCALYRNPGLLAQMAATVDAASGGRLVVGVGAGWDEREYRDFGYGDELPPIRERLAHLEQTLRVLRERQRSPILVGGAGEKVLLRLVAQHGDACNLTDTFDPAFYRHKLDVLRRHCEDVGRDEAEIEKTASFTVTPDLEAETLRAIAAEGIETFVLYVDPPTDLRALERVARLL